MRWTRDVFSTARPDTDPDGNGENIEIENQFADQCQDNETGLHYNGFRHYNPDTGRYMSSDPIDLAGGTSTYGYAMGDPVLLLDIMGLKVYCIYEQDTENLSCTDMDTGKSVVDS